ncbi:hypothetical protein [Sphingosinithalassobacter portus]|uniref:hypothetical protein n=1 Tax=Stakelama portus TaxID=2676234 RepID=UPI0011AB7480|nr:hypothetical protein [Sphingosinithalassobacter portus]
MRQQPQADQIAEMMALTELSRQRPLSPEESERLGELIQREQRRARYRPARIAKLRAELELLEALEIADRGGNAVREAESASVSAVDLSADALGQWRLPQSRAA